MGGDALIDEAAALYALRPDEFTAARNDRSRALRGDDREMADDVLALRRPAPAAWIVNQLVRHRRDELDGLLALGAELRAAQNELDAPTMARLAKQRRGLVAALARGAGELAEELGSPVRQPVLDEVAQTLNAGMVDASAADAIVSGRLVRSLEAVGLEVDLDGAVAGGPGGPTPTTRSARPSARARRRSGDDGAAEREEQARRERAEREQAAAEAEQRAAEASAALDELEDELTGLTERIAADSARRDELDAELREVEDRLGEHGREQRRLGRERDRAARAAESARDEAAAAREALH
ncbi:transposase [Agromyces lapidis]|uniref:Transposase n=1 Tax=Agromyces lapidis TaxID=279574 RepID=A0ABV5STY9_9MICO|nr:transposase [Agromyces lapidis]